MRSNMLTVVVADRKLSITPLLVCFVNNADITTTENRPFFWIIGYCKLYEVEMEFFSHAQAENKAS